MLKVRPQIYLKKSGLKHWFLPLSPVNLETKLHLINPDKDVFFVKNGNTGKEGIVGAITHCRTTQRTPNPLL